jgi:hypothetical protein
MRFARSALIFCIFVCISSFAAGPNDRTVTDPRSIISFAHPAARPVPIDDLYYTRSLGGASWSPDGKDFVFTTNISGRMNLWKVSAAGGWPIQLTQSDERQYNSVWSRMVNGSSFSKTRAAMSYGISLRCRVRVGKLST